MHSKAALRRSNPSSTVCLNGPISTSRISSFCKEERKRRGRERESVCVCVMVCIREMSSFQRVYIVYRVGGLKMCPY